MHLIKCQASFKYCNDSNRFCRKIYISIPWASCQSAQWKTNRVTPVTVMIRFQKESISMVVSDNKHHDKRTVVPYLSIVFNCERNVWRKYTKHYHLGRYGLFSQFKNNFVFSSISHKIPMLFLHYHHKHGIMQQQVMERRLWFVMRAIMSGTVELLLQMPSHLYRQFHSKHIFT